MQDLLSELNIIRVTLLQQGRIAEHNQLELACFFISRHYQEGQSESATIIDLTHLVEWGREIKDKR